jgi:hypothetical protein
MKQTAVEWIEDNVHSDMTFMQVLILIEQALKMEKEQIVDAYNQGSLDTCKKEPKNVQGTKYYNETFKK